MDRVYVKKLNPNAILPVRANPGDAGADVFYAGENIVVIEPMCSVVLGTGLQIATPLGYVTEVKNRSGMAAKKSLIVGACIIDSGYEGEVKINLHNIGKDAKVISPGDKIAQIVVYPVQKVAFEELSEEEGLYSKTNTNSSRGAGGFGSTGF